MAVVPVTFEVIEVVSEVGSAVQFPPLIALAPDVQFAATVLFDPSSPWSSLGSSKGHAMYDVCVVAVMPHPVIQVTFPG